MAKQTILEMGPEEKQRLLGELRRRRFGHLLGLHIVLLCAAGCSPTEIAAVLFCSRTSIYRVVEAYREGRLTEETAGEVPSLPVRATGLRASVCRTLKGLLEKGPQAFGWCRTRWSCATLVLELKAQQGLEVSAETLRRWLHQMDWVWKRAKHIARDDDPERAEKLARIRQCYEQIEELGPSGKRVMLFADELDIHLLPKVGFEWMPRAEQAEVWTPGKNHKAYLAAAWNAHSGQVIGCFSERKTNALFLQLLEAIEKVHPASSCDKIHVVLDNYGIHKAKAVERWLKEHPRFELLFLPSYCPKANPIERIFGDVHDHCTRNHKRTSLDDLLQDVVDYILDRGLWPYRLSDIYLAPEVTQALQALPPVLPSQRTDKAA